MTELPINQSESLSALMDGELHGPAQQSAMAALLAEPTARTTWHAYHVVGDVLRSEALSGAAQDLEFWAKLETRLAREPLPPTAALPVLHPNPLPLAHSLQSANGPVFWRVVAGMACSVLVAVIGISVWVPDRGSPPVSMAVITPPAVTGNSAQFAQAVPVDIAEAPGGMIRDPRLDQLLRAHQQLGGHSALQMPSGFLRNATYQEAGR